MLVAGVAGASVGVGVVIGVAGVGGVGGLSASERVDARASKSSVLVAQAA